MSPAETADIRASSLTGSLSKGLLAVRGAGPGVPPTDVTGNPNLATAPWRFMARDQRLGDPLA